MPRKGQTMSAGSRAKMRTSAKTAWHRKRQKSLPIGARVAIDPRVLYIGGTEAVVVPPQKVREEGTVTVSGAMGCWTVMREMVRKVR